MLQLVAFSALLALTVAVVPPWNGVNGPCGDSRYQNAGEMELPPGTRMIVGGIAAQPHEFPWQVSCRRKATNSHFCGGSIINSRWIITAAHCMSGETPAILSIVIGDHTRNEGNANRLSLDVDRIVMHPNYNARTLVNDIALVRVTAAHNIQFHQNVQPICGPDNANLFVHQKCSCSGWGTLSSGGACCPQTLQYVTMNITTNAYCDAAYPRDNISADMICATDNTGSRQRDSCQGDSGGPLMVKGNDGRFTLVGIVSWGIGCASGYPGVYARVTHFHDWILGIINTP